jgi:hypothetical protein
MIPDPESVLVGVLDIGTVAVLNVPCATIANDTNDRMPKSVVSRSIMKTHRKRTSPMPFSKRVVRPTVRQKSSSGNPKMWALR